MLNNTIRQRKLFKRNESLSQCRRFPTETTLGDESVSDISNKLECLIERRESYSSRPTIHPGSGISKQMQLLEQKVHRQEDTMNKCLEEMQELDADYARQLSELQEEHAAKIKKVYTCITAQEQRNAAAQRKYLQTLNSFCHQAFISPPERESYSQQSTQAKKSCLSTQNSLTWNTATMAASKRKIFLQKIRQEMSSRQVEAIKQQELPTSRERVESVEQTLLLSLRTDRESESILLDGVSFLE